MKKRTIIALTLMLLIVFLVGCSKKQEKNQTSKGDEIIQTDTENKDENNNGSEEIQEDEDEKYVLFLKQKNEPYIVPETYNISLDDLESKDKSIEQIALEHLISYDEFQGLISPIPKGTELLNFKKEDEVITVDFSKEFINKMKKDEYYTRVCISAIIDTLTINNQNTRVIITVEGEKIKMLNGFNMDKGLEFNDDYFLDNK